MTEAPEQGLAAEVPTAEERRTRVGLAAGGLDGDVMGRREGMSLLRCQAEAAAREHAVFGEPSAPLEESVVNGPLCTSPDHTGASEITVL